MKRSKEQRELQRERMRRYWDERRAREASGVGGDETRLERLLNGVGELLWEYLGEEPKESSKLGENRGEPSRPAGGDAVSGGSSPSAPIEPTVVNQEPIPTKEVVKEVAKEILGEVSEEEFRRRYLAKKLAAIGS